MDTHVRQTKGSGKPDYFNGLSMIDSSTSVNESQAEKQIDNIINTKIFQAIISGKKEVFFESKDFSDLEYEKDYPKSFELDFIITFLNNQYYLYLGPNSGSSKGGAMFQRFANCFDTLDLKKYNEIYKMEEKLFHEEFLLVEAREFSANGMLENVMNTKKNYKYFITFGNCFEDNGNEITLEDIYVGLSSENEIYLKSRKYNKKIKLVKDNMLNPNMMNKILKLLRIISESSDFFPEYRVMSFRNRFGFKYIPRINFEGIVVSPRRWVLDEIDITYKSYKEFKIKLTKNMEVYGIDSIVYYVYLDNRIIVDLKKDDYIEILYTEFKKMKRLEFQELEKGLMDGALVKDINGNKYINEFVFTLIALRGQEKKFPIMSNDISVVDKNNRFLLGEDGWVFFKLYGLGNRDNEVLCSWLPNLLNILGKPSHFFIRYTDYNGEHLRVRNKFQNEKEAYNKLEIIVNWTKKMITNKVVNNVVFDVYNREINRYGASCIIQI